MDLSRLGVCYPKHMAAAAFYLAERPSGLGRMLLLCQIIVTHN
jgi:hypothetical protein